MQLEALFEKREKGQLALITTLMEQPAKAMLKDIMAKTTLSRTTLIKYIEDLNNLAKKNDFELTISFVDDHLALSMGHQVTKEDLVQLILPYSIKIKILNYLYSKEEFTVQKLSQ